MRPAVGAMRSLRVSWRKPMPIRLLEPASPPPFRQSTRGGGSSALSQPSVTTSAPAPISRQIMLAAFTSRLSSISRWVQA